MPRRRMIDPFFWNDRKVGKLSRDGRSLIIGCVGQADDDGRLQADPAFLKSAIYKYDDDLDATAVKELRDKCLSQMSTWPLTHPYRMVLYQSSDEEYIFFPSWNATNRPSHPTKSQLPPPPPESLPIFSGTNPEELPKASALGQSSQGKVSIGQVSAVQEDFARISDSETDLTDLLTTTLTENISAGQARAAESGELTQESHATLAGAWGVPVLREFWAQLVGKIPTAIFDGGREALKKYPVEVVAKAFVKASRYKGGKHQSWKYIQTIIDEEVEKRGIERNRSLPVKAGPPVAG